MINKLANFSKLPFWKKRIIVEALILMPVIKLIIQLIPIKIYGPILLGKHMSSTPEQPITEKEEVVSAVSKLVTYIGNRMIWRKKCFATAVTAKIILKFHGVKSTLYLGVIKKYNLKPYPHSWLRAGDFYVTGGNGENYTRLSSFS